MLSAQKREARLFTDRHNPPDYVPFFGSSLNLNVEVFFDIFSYHLAVEQVHDSMRIVCIIG
jgi:hypothetical protein